MLLFEDVHRVFRRGQEEVHALCGVSFEAERGEWVTVIGPSGCGKSTLLSLVAAVDVPDSGRLELCGVELAGASEAQLLQLRREHIGVVFQAFHLMPHLSVEENVALPLHLAGRSDPDRVRHLVDRVGLDHRRTHLPSELSGGEQQRTAVARALVHRPSIVVADEPTGNLDTENGSAVVQLMRELRREEHATVLLATHDGSLSRGADLCLHMRDGRLGSARRR